jgi:hypothetical protein
MSNEIISMRRYKARYIEKDEIEGELIIYESKYNNKLIFKSKYGIISIPINDIKVSSIITKVKGLIIKKNDKMLLVEYNNKRLGDVKIILDVKDDEADDIISYINRLRDDHKSERRVKIFYKDDDVKEVIIDPWSEHLYKGEDVLWFYEIDNKSYIITIFRIMIIDNEVDEVMNMILLQDLDDVIVMNTYRNSSFISSGIYTGYANRFFGGTVNSYSSGKSRTFGDILFMNNGKSEVIFRNIQDPKGLARLVKSVKRQLYPKDITKFIN